jgi:hypothetical protein
MPSVSSPRYHARNKREYYTCPLIPASDAAPSGYYGPKNLFELVGPPAPARIARQARDAAVDRLGATDRPSFFRGLTDQRRPGTQTPGEVRRSTRPAVPRANHTRENVAWPRGAIEEHGSITHARKVAEAPLGAASFEYPRVCDKSPDPRGKRFIGALIPWGLERARGEVGTGGGFGGSCLMAEVGEDRYRDRFMDRTATKSEQVAQAHLGLNDGEVELAFAGHLQFPRHLL